MVKGAVQHHHPDRQPGVSAGQQADAGRRSDQGKVREQVEDIACDRSWL